MDTISNEIKGIQLELSPRSLLPLFKKKKKFKSVDMKKKFFLEMDEIKVT